MFAINNGRIDMNFITICISKFLVAFGNFVITFLTLFLISYKGVSEGTAGMLVTIISFSYIPATILGGKLSYDNIKKKLVLLFTLAGLCYILIPLFKDIFLIQFLLIFVGKFLITVSEPIFNNTINLSSGTSAKKKTAFSTVYLFVNLGFALGPLFAGSLFYKNIYLIFVLDSICKLLVAVLIAAFYIPFEEKITEDKKSSRKRNNYLSLLKNPILIAFSLLILILNFTYSQNGFTLTVFINTVFEKSGAKYYGYLMSANAIVIIFFTAIVNKLTKQINAYKSLGLAGAFLTIGFGGYYFTNSLLTAIGFTAIWSIGEILLYTNMSVSVNDIVGEEKFGLANALVNVISRTGMIFNPAIMGMVLKMTGARTVWIIIALITLIASAIIGVSSERLIKNFKNSMDTELKKCEKL